MDRTPTIAELKRARLGAYQVAITALSFQAHVHGDSALSDFLRLLVEELNDRANAMQADLRSPPDEPSGEPN